MILRAIPPNEKHHSCLLEYLYFFQSPLERFKNNKKFSAQCTDDELNSKFYILLNSIERRLIFAQGLRSLFIAKR